MYEAAWGTILMRCKELNFESPHTIRDMARAVYINVLMHACD